jgi:S-adenosylmethionine:tRNA ribosyltransferase-isomerase
MRIEELDYELPEELIAQHPLERREEARMMVVDRARGTFEHSRFYKLGRHLVEGDLIVLNDTRVIAARLFAHKESGGRIELLMIRPHPDPPGAWLAMIRSHRPVKQGARLALNGADAIRVVGYARAGRVIVRGEGGVSIEEIIRRAGHLALPHYVRREADAADSSDYQTVYAAHDGAIAAPTAGLHFSDELLRALAEAGVGHAFVTLHIGPATFAPLRAAEVERHAMEAEWYTMPRETVDAVAHARRTGGRVVAVGTSSVRALESHAITGDTEGFTGLFIYPGFRFKLVDAMITNFHMPRSTVLAMVMAFAGRETILNAYREARRHRYRFLSYGDAMLIV